MNNTNNLLFAPTHEWIKPENHRRYWVGISNHAQEALGDILYLQLPELGSQVKQGQPCASIESLKAASDIHAPISGTVVDIHHDASENPQRINQEPYQTWLFKIEVDNEDVALNELAALQGAQEYESGNSN